MHILLVRLLQGAAAAVVLLFLRVVSFLFKCFLAHRRFKHSPIPGPPEASVILGNIPQIYGPKGVWVMAEWANVYGPLYKVHFLNDFVLVCSDPDTIGRITRKTGPGPYCPKPRAFYEALEAAIKPKLPNIVTAEDGDYWKAVRQGAAPCFSVSNMKKVLPMVVELTKRVAERMSQQQLVDVADGAKRITSDVMGDMLLGEDLGGTRWEPGEYLNLLPAVLKAQGELMNNPLHLWRVWRQDVRDANARVRRHNSIMDDKVARLIKCPPPEYTIAAHLLRIKDPATGKPLTANQLKAEIAIIMAAGFETSSHAISWTFALLASHPDIQEQLFQELVAAGLAPAADGSSPGRDFAASDLGRLPLLSAVIKESLRVCPPAPFGGSRVCPADGSELCGHKVDKGTILMLCALPIAMAKHCFGPDAAEFRPDRWRESTTTAQTASGTPPSSPSDDTGTQRDTSAAGFKAAAASSKAAAAPAGPAGSVSGPPPDPCTFMVGRRDCVGQNLAMLELQVVVATLLCRLRFSPGPELAKELEVAAATGQTKVAAIHALAGVHVTLQPLSGVMELAIEPRAGSV